MKKILLTIVLAILFFVLIIAAYVGYVYFSYARIDDYQVQTFDIEEDAEPAPLDTTLTAVTYNIGYGAYVPEYSFFMDGGTESRAFSMQDATNAVNGSMELVKKLKPDFVLLQEVDLDADRSYSVNQLNLVKRKFEDYYTQESVNYDSAFLFYPLTDPIGASLSSIVTSSRYPMATHTRRSLPMPDNFTKLLDLDRCYSVAEIPVDDEQTLYLYNVHLIAYGGSTDIATQQVRMLLDDMKEKADAGGFVICGGDFNHDLLDSYARFNGVGLELPGWAEPFPIELMPEGLRLLNEYTVPVPAEGEESADELIPTSRMADKPYVSPADAILVIIDGFIVSDNVLVKAIDNIDAQFEFSDHNPVLLRFQLMSEAAREKAAAAANAQ
jgi:hypothetical protein